MTTATPTCPFCLREMHSSRLSVPAKNGPSHSLYHCYCDAFKCIGWLHEPEVRNLSNAVMEMHERYYTAGWLRSYDRWLDDEFLEDDTDGPGRDFTKHIDRLKAEAKHGEEERK